ncbi:MAG: UvrD-helicase domain-containing protein, partial [Thermoplasmata archaeon]
MAFRILAGGCEESNKKEGYLHVLGSDKHRINETCFKQICISWYKDAMIEMQKATIIVARPGTGKTTELSKYYIKLIREAHSQENIMCITYTNKAVDNLRESIFKNAEAENVKLDRNKINVRTFHSY